MQRTHRLIVIAACLAGTSLATAETVYDNTDTDLGSLSFTALQIGDSVTIEADSAIITEVLIGVSQQGFAGTADLQARLYANDGPGGLPGTLLWESELMDDIELTGADDLVSFDVPSIEVPQSFTWTLQNSDTTPVAVGMPHYDPPSIGSSPDHALFGSAGSWTMLNPGAAPVNFMARIIATSSDCPADLDGDGTVGPADLAQLLGSWGTCEGCPADLDGDLSVTPSDLALLLGAWGRCS